MVSSLVANSVVESRVVRSEMKFELMQDAYKGMMTDLSRLIVMPNVITAREGTIMVTMAVRVTHVNELTEIEGMEMKKCIREEEDMIQDHHIVGKKSVCQVMMTIKTLIMLKKTSWLSISLTEVLIKEDVGLEIRMERLVPTLQGKTTTKTEGHSHPRNLNKTSSRCKTNPLHRAWVFTTVIINSNSFETLF